MKNNAIVHYLISALGALLMAALFLFSPAPFQSMDHNLRDLLFHLRGEVPTTEQVVIVDVDEKSLTALGQWPWERNLVAKLLHTLSEDGAGIIGFDIVFSEADKTSPAYLAHKLNLALDNPPDYDAIFAEAIASTPTILGYVFDMNQPTPHAERPVFSGSILEKNRPEQPNFFKPEGLLPNLEILQARAKSSGFFNNLPDDTGMIRSVPLVMQYQGEVYPSLALEMLRVKLESPILKIVHSDEGIESIALAEHNIPTDRYGQLFVNYRGPSKTFPYISAIDVINNRYDPEDIKDRWVLIGTSATGLLDLRAMPFDTVYPGVEAHATVIDNVLKGDLIAKPLWIDAANLVLIMTLFIVSYLGFKSLKALWIPLAAIFGFGLLFLFFYYMLFSQGIIFNLLFPLLSFFLALLLSILTSYFFENKQKKLIKNKLSSKVSPSVMDAILENESDNIMRGQAREITIFFSDLRNFTQLSEMMGEPQLLIDFLNRYTTPMTEIIVENQGTVDKFIGDAIMAYWNAPAKVNNHADLALKASIEQLQLVKKLNKNLERDSRFHALLADCKTEGIQPLEIGIGLNTGEAIVGEMGSAGRSDYTVIGETVNLGARLEDLCKFYSAPLIISDHTKSRLQEPYCLRLLDLITVKGSRQSIKIWQVHGSGLPEGPIKDELDQYHQAVKLYQQADFQSALVEFTRLNQAKNNANTKLYTLYIERCLEALKSPPKDFHGIFNHSKNNLMDKS